ncbi:MAG: hypothetical protein HGA22_14410 [Clostridiales bacterium]|nr:hypothetical protein [Clostridiales bacterium]
MMSVKQAENGSSAGNDDTLRGGNKKRKLLVHNIALPVLGLAYVWLFTRAAMKGMALEAAFSTFFFLGLSFMSIHKPEGLLRVTHAFSVRRIREIEVSEFHAFFFRICGIVLFIFAFASILIFAK